MIITIEHDGVKHETELTGEMTHEELIWEFKHLLLGLGYDFGDSENEKIYEHHDAIRKKIKITELYEDKEN